MDINRFTPEGKLEKKHLISLANYKEEEILEILHKTKDIERKLNAGEKLADLKGKFVCLITKHGFTRSRIAFETAVTRLSGSPVVCAVRGTELETMINDKLSMSAVAGYGVNAVVVQTSEETDAEAMERGLDIPVINANAKSGTATPESRRKMDATPTSVVNRLLASMAASSSSEEKPSNCSRPFSSRRELALTISRSSAASSLMPLMLILGNRTWIRLRRSAIIYSPKKIPNLAGPWD